jgi:hypothetical protein
MRVIVCPEANTLRSDVQQAFGLVIYVTMDKPKGGKLQ